MLYSYPLKPVLLSDKVGLRIDNLQLFIKKIDYWRMVVMLVGQSICHYYHADKRPNGILGINKDLFIDDLTDFMLGFENCLWRKIYE